MTGVITDSSVPERLGLLAAGSLAAAAVWPSFAEVSGATLPCPLRSVTGIPCPLCGMTTASVALVRGRWAEAVAANPLVLLLAAMAAVMAVVVVLRCLRVVPRPAPTDTTIKVGTRVGAAVALASWVYQLHRFDVV